MSLHSAFMKGMLLSVFWREAWLLKASISKWLRALTCPTTHRILYFHLILLPQLPQPARFLYFASNPPACQFACILLSDFHFPYFSANFRPVSWQLTTELAPELSLVNFPSLVDHLWPGSGSLWMSWPLACFCLSSLKVLWCSGRTRALESGNVSLNLGLSLFELVSEPRSASYDFCKMGQ